MSDLLPPTEDKPEEPEVPFIYTQPFEIEITVPPEQLWRILLNLHVQITQFYRLIRCCVLFLRDLSDICRFRKFGFLKQIDA